MTPKRHIFWSRGSSGERHILMSGESQAKAEVEIFEIRLKPNSDGSIGVVGTGIKFPLKQRAPAKTQLPKGSGKRKSK